MLVRKVLFVLVIPFEGGYLGLDLLSSIAVVLLSTLTICLNEIVSPHGSDPLEVGNPSGSALFLSFLEGTSFFLSQSLLGLKFFEERQI